MELWEADDVVAYLTERDGRAGPLPALEDMADEAFPPASAETQARIRREMTDIGGMRG